MTLDPLAVIGAIAAMGTLLLFIVRAFATGAIMPRSVVPREDYEAMQAVVASYAPAVAALTEAVKGQSESVKKLTVAVALWSKADRTIVRAE